jgi:hypothetical protein
VLTNILEKGNSVLGVNKLRLNTSVAHCHFSHVSLCLTHNFITWNSFVTYMLHISMESCHCQPVDKSFVLQCTNFIHYIVVIWNLYNLKISICIIAGINLQWWVNYYGKSWFSFFTVYVHTQCGRLTQYFQIHKVSSKWLANFKDFIDVMVIPQERM